MIEICIKRKISSTLGFSEMNVCNVSVGDGETATLNLSVFSLRIVS